MGDPSKTTEQTSRIGPDKHTSLGSVRPHGHLGDIEYLKWVRRHDWASTSCGPIETWTDDLRQAYQLALASPDPTCLLWGSDYTMLYNKPYSIMIEGRHPKALGRPMVENWPEVFPVYKKLFWITRQTGQPIQHENISRIWARGGYPEQIYANLTFLPILDKNESVAGLWVYVHETTRQVILEKRIMNLADMSNRLAHSTALSDIWTSLMAVLDECKDDIYFAAAYEVKLSVGTSASARLNLEITHGMADRLGSHPELDAAIHRTMTTGVTTLLSMTDGSLSEALRAYLQEHGVRGPCREVVIQALRCNLDGAVVAVLITGINPMRKFNEDLQSFIQLLARQLESSITNIMNMAKEKARLEHEFATKMNKRFWHFSEKAPIGIYTYDREGIMTYYNKAFEDLTGVSQEAIARPMGWTDVVHPDCLDRVISVWEKVVNDDSDCPPSFDVQFKRPWAPRGRHESLDRTWCLATSYPEISEEGEVTGVIGCVVDVSSLKWAESIQSERLSEALEIRRQQENFFDVTSHELRNPLSAIIHSACELVDQLTKLSTRPLVSLEATSQIDYLIEMATTIIYCGNHQKRILDDVLTLSKLDSNLLQIFPISTNPAKLVTEVVAIFSSELRTSEIDLEVHLGDDYRRLGVETVLLDPHRITQVMVNLLSNAIKFLKSESQRHIRLSVDASLVGQEQDPHVRYVPSRTGYCDPTNNAEWGAGEPLYVSFSVQDTGPGMTQQEASRLFKQFSQASPRTHAKYGGSGLGLFISRELTEMHGGRIGLSTEQGHGSIFSFHVKTRRDVSCQTSEIPILDKMSLPPIQHLKVATPPLESHGQLEIITIHEQLEQLAKADPLLPPPSLILERVVKKLLIVEDNLINQRLLEKLFIKHGYEVAVANDGEEALAIIMGSAWNCSLARPAQPRFDLVLSDIEMPIMDGKTCVRRIRQLQQEGMLHAHIPVLAVTGNAQMEKVKEAQECGFDAVVTKPYVISELLKVVHEHSSHVWNAG
ncbi:hypothetical protein BKA67DRAFT_516759 [Truncatella angustata]|uniref:Uncharacterized protein n=1 Tax=Truncatella angustata TaxID=152316 RepID=A0A9P8UMS0_9PEZI|nr:uncharacterized protein BKA67DRAFT_516759 [Truncatella angustata]KAH6654916.1 hypothetical protein BKA67DRAFT_516759 [Truncatella angustata]